MAEKTLQQLAWEETMTKKYGNLEIARQIMSERGKKSAGVSKQTHLQNNPNKASEIGKLGAMKRWNKNENQ